MHKNIALAFRPYLRNTPGGPAQKFPHPSVDSCPEVQGRLEYRVLLTRKKRRYPWLGSRVSLPCLFARTHAMWFQSSDSSL